MREILFRGKRTTAAGFVYGFYAVFDGRNHSISNDDGNYWVDPETVGQFTGLTDKNGKMIFEGDIVRVLGNQQVEDWKNVDYIGSIAFLDAGFCVIDGTIEDHCLRRYALPRLDFDLDVVGNIHDNPELLEVNGDG